MEPGGKTIHSWGNKQKSESNKHRHGAHGQDPALRSLECGGGESGEAPTLRSDQAQLGEEVASTLRRTKKRMKLHSGPQVSSVNPTRPAVAKSRPLLLEQSPREVKVWEWETGFAVTGMVRSSCGSVG